MVQLFGNMRHQSTLLDQEQRKTAVEVDYMELPGAKKDADCRRVEVKDGVSKQLGCCNDFKFNPETKELFSCGTCKFVMEKA